MWAIKTLVLRGGSTTALPVTLVDFTAEAVDNKYIHIPWETASEINNKGFHLMRSTDALTWEALTTVPSKASGGNSSSNLSYSYDDHTVIPNKVYYYQLIQEDVDGNETPSIIASAMITSTRVSSMVCYPSPSSGDITIAVSLSDISPATIEITNLLGQVVYSEELSGDNSFQKQIQLNSSGQYEVRVTTPDKVFTQKIVVLTK